MSDDVVHDEECRISHAVKYFFQHVDNKYYNLIGPRGLERWRERWGYSFGYFAEKIRAKVLEGRLWYDSDTSTLTADEGV
jgi:hypothetical protein